MLIIFHYHIMGIDRCFPSKHGWWGVHFNYFQLHFSRKWMDEKFWKKFLKIFKNMLNNIGITMGLFGTMVVLIHEWWQVQNGSHIFSSPHQKSIHAFFGDRVTIVTRSHSAGKGCGLTKYVRERLTKVWLGHHSLCEAHMWLCHKKYVHGLSASMSLSFRSFIIDEEEKKKYS